jgi:hypothetical protein
MLPNQVSPLACQFICRFRISGGIRWRGYAVLVGVLCLVASGNGATQLLSNPGFELGNIDWKSNGSGTAAMKSSSSLAHSGSWYADLIASSGTHPVLFAPTPRMCPSIFP